MINNPLVSFLLVTYNHEKYIEEAIIGALSQKYSPLEIIISDDASSDKTFEIAKDLVSQYKGPHKIILNQNQTNLYQVGLGAHINKIISMCSGELLVMASGDDISLKDRVSSLVNYWSLDGRPSGMLISKSEVIDSNSISKGQILESKINFNKMSLKDAIKSGMTGTVGGTPAVTTDIFNYFGPIPNETLFEDRVLAFRSYIYGKILYCPIVLVKYRIHNNNLSGFELFKDSNKVDQWIDGLVSCYRTFLLDYKKLMTEEKSFLEIEIEIEKCISIIEKTRGLTSENFYKKVTSAYYYSFGSPMPDRIAYFLKILNWEETIFFKLLSILWKFYNFISKKNSKILN
jgi:glycosyltransferase involved in cell wall biosynthesis